MLITLDFKLKDELSDDEIKSLSKLHLKRGLMWGYFKENDECSVILAYYKNVIIGWGLIYYSEDRKCNEFHIYVNKDYRRKGIGTQIFELASEIFDTGLWVSKWSKQADGFYNQFETLEIECDEDNNEIKDDKDNE